MNRTFGSAGGTFSRTRMRHAIVAPLPQDLDNAVTRALASSSSPHTPAAKWARRWLYKIDRRLEVARAVADTHTPLGIAASAVVAYLEAQGFQGSDYHERMATAERYVLAVLA